MKKFKRWEECTDHSKGIFLKVHRVKSSWIELGVAFKVAYVCHGEIRNVETTKDF